MSALLVAPAGGGKTTLMERFDSEFAPFLSDATSRELSKVLKEKPRANHLLIGDMIAIMRHKKSTTDLTMNLLSQLSGDTLRTDSFTGTAMNKRMGIVTALPDVDFKTSQKVKRAIGEGGFASRFLIINYSYRPETIEAIHEFIKKGLYRNIRPAPVLIGPPVRKIALRDSQAEEIKNIALLIKRDPIGARAHHHLRALAMGIAAKHGERRVSSRNMKELRSYLDFFTERGKEL